MKIRRTCLVRTLFVPILLTALPTLGNAYEGVADYANSYPGNAKPFDHSPGYHFVRGGCWDDGPFSVRCAYRGWYLPPEPQRHRPRGQRLFRIPRGALSDRFYKSITNSNTSLST